MLAILSAFAILMTLIVLVLSFSRSGSGVSNPLTAHAWRVSYPLANPVWASITFSDNQTFSAMADDGSTISGTYDKNVLYPQKDRKDVFLPYMYVPNDDSISVVTLGGKSDVHIFNDASKMIVPTTVPPTVSPATTPPQGWCQCICATQPDACDENGMVMPYQVKTTTYEQCYARTGQITGPCLVNNV